MPLCSFSMERAVRMNSPPLDTVGVPKAERSGFNDDKNKITKTTFKCIDPTYWIFPIFSHQVKVKATNIARVLVSNLPFEKNLLQRLNNHVVTSMTTLFRQILI